jgi:hypothetical protein
MEGSSDWLGAGERPPTVDERDISRNAVSLREEATCVRLGRKGLLRLEGIYTCQARAAQDQFRSDGSSVILDATSVGLVTSVPFSPERIRFGQGSDEIARPRRARGLTA